MATQKPTHTIRLGKIYVSIWANQTESKDVWYSVTVKRRFKSNGEWKDSQSFGRDDLPVVSKAVDMAYSWIWEQPEIPQRSHRQRMTSFSFAPDC